MWVKVSKAGDPAARAGVMGSSRTEAWRRAASRKRSFESLRRGGRAVGFSPVVALPVVASRPGGYQALSLQSCRGTLRRHALGSACHEATPGARRLA